jgi:membrane protein
MFIVRFFKKIWLYLKDMYAEWQADGCFQMAAALSYYTIFSLAPMLLVVIFIAGQVFGRESMTNEVYDQMKGLVGEEGAKGLQNMIQHAYQSKDGFIAKTIGLVTLFLSATLAFTSLQDALNRIWKVKPNPKKGLLRVIFSRIMSFALVVGLGFTLMVSLVVEALLTILQRYIEQLLKGVSVYVLQGIQFGISFVISTLIFAAIFKFLPDAKIRWRRVWKGALLTAALFAVGRWGIGLYLGGSNLTSTYGAAASLVILLLWINYSSWIFFIGAEYIYVHTRRKGEYIEPSRFAVRIESGRSEHEVVSDKEVDAHLDRTENTPPAPKSEYKL